jgi:hypothetical protein
MKPITTVLEYSESLTNQTKRIFGEELVSAAYLRRDVYEGNMTGTCHFTDNGTSEISDVYNDIVITFCTGRSVCITFSEYITIEKAEVNVNLDVPSTHKS